MNATISMSSRTRRSDRLIRRTSTPSPIRKPDVTVADWLDSLGLTEYSHLFTAYRSVQELLVLSEGDIRELGVRNGGHRARLVSSLVVLREAQQRYASSSARQPSYGTIVDTSRQPLHVCSDDRSVSCATCLNCHSSPRCSTMQQQQPGVVGGPSPSDVASHGWYHGTLPRVDAEALVQRDGEYLVRDSSTQAGSFVLTLRWAGVPLHFVINQRPSSDVASRTLYHFEEDLFGSVSELLDWYVSRCKPITETSGAIASVPVLRVLPLTMPCYSEPAVTTLRHRSPDRPCSVPTIPRFTAVDIDLPVDDVASTLSLPVRGPQRVGSEPLLSPPPLSKAHSGTLDWFIADSKNILSGSDSDLTRPPPPKPTRLPTIRIGRDEKKPLVQIRNPALYDDGSDYSDYSQVKSYPRKLAQADEETYDTPSSTCITASSFVMSDFVSRSQFALVTEHDSQFLPPDNRPLDSSALSIMKSLVLDTSPHILARHITLFDINLLRIAGHSDIGFGLFSGLELITLPQGSCLRQDVIERFYCLQLLVSVLILRSSNSVERVRMINHWIQTAVELRHSTVGNLYSFSAVMHSLLSAPISRLSSAWQRLADQFSTSSSVFQVKLCSLQSSLDASSGTLPLQSVTVPHVLPLAELLEMDTTALDGYTLDAAFAHMDLARLVAAESRLYNSTALALMASRDCVDAALIDMLSTMTHMRLLWGARGVGVQRADRLAKFQQVLDTFSDKVEPRESSL